MSTGFSRRVISRTLATKLLAEPKRRDHWLQVLAAYLIAHKRTDEADMIANDIAHELFAQGGTLLVTVTTAKELGASISGSLQKMLTEQTGAKKLEFAEHTDSNILGGLIARTPDAVLDISVRAKLNQLATITS